MEATKLSLLGKICDIDLFGKNVDIYYKGKSRINSWIGRVLTFLYIGIYLLFFIFRLIKMIRKDDVTFYDTYAFNGKPPFIQLNNEIFYSGMALVNPLTGMPFIDPSIYNIKIIYNSKDFNYELPIETCNINQFGSHYREYFTDIDLNNLYCVRNYNQSLQGSFQDEEYSGYYISFFPCVNTSKNNNMCATKENITKFFAKFYITFIMQDIVLNPKDYKNPVKYKPKQLYLSLQSDLYITIQSFWQVVNIETDEDIFGFGTSNHIRKEKYLKFEQFQLFYYTNKLDLDNPDKPLISLNIGLSEQELTQTRTYIKLISVIGDVGGFMEVIFSSFTILAEILTDTLFTKSLANHLFSFDLDKKLVLVKKKDINIFKTQKSQQINIPDKLLKVNKSKNNNEEEEKKIKDIKNNKGNNNDNIQKQNSEQNFIKRIK